MVTFLINNDKINYYNVWYHYQKTPKPGGNNYSVIVTFDEKVIIKRLEKVIGKIVHDESFKTLALKEYKSSFNLIQYIIDELENSSDKFNIKWVFNNIEDVRIEKDNLIITGTASEALDNF